MEFEKVKVKLITEKVTYNQDLKIQNPKDIVKFVNEIEEITSEVQEYAYLIMLNNKNNVISYTELAHSGYNYTDIDMKLIFQNVLLNNANKIILVHNHLTGDTTPSNQDVECMEKLEKACKIMNVDLLDSIIIAPSNVENEINHTSIKSYLQYKKV